MAKRTDVVGARARKLLHWATGDRRKEAEALVDEGVATGATESDEVSVDQAESEVKRAHGDHGIGTKAAAEPDVAKPSAVLDERGTEGSATHS